MKNSVLFVAVAVMLLTLANESHGQTLYSYIDENGVQVFTNIPPVNRGEKLKVRGSVPSPAPPSSSNMKSQSIDAIIEKYASHYSLDPSLIRSIIATESAFNPTAVSPKGARGLMQLMPATAEKLGVRNSFDPEQNIHGGVKHFRSLLDNFNNNLVLSLAAYNAGENLVQRLGRVPAIKETRDYVQSVTKKYGSKELLPRQEAKRTMYRYFDESGVLHLTNIPPLR